MKYRDQFLPIISIFLVLLLAVVLRLYRLDLSPKGALIDEAHFGYLAKSLLLTGKDEHGVSWPLVFKGFGDQKLPGYAYLLIPFVAVFDLSVMTIRLPSVVVGSLSVVLIYILARQIGFRHWTAWIGALLMAVSPWPFFLSRIGFESNLALFFWILGLIGLVSVLKASTEKSVRKKTQLQEWLPAIAAGVAFAATWYCYIAYRPVSVGVLVLVTAVSVIRQRQLLKKLAVVWLSFLIFVAPFFLPSVREANTARLEQVGLFSDSHDATVIDEYRTFCDMQLPLPVCSLVWNKGTLAVQRVAARFVHTYSPEFLATDGEANETFLTVKNFGQFVLIIYPFIWLGLAELLLLRKKLRMVEWLILIGLVVCPLPTILAGEPQKVRLSELLPFLILVVLYGLHACNVWLEKIKLPKLSLVWAKRGVALGVVVLFSTATFSYFVDYYTVHAIKNDYMYQSYLRELFPLLKEKYGDQHLLVKPFFSDPTMFYAFYTNMDPRQYQEQAVLGPLEDSGFQHTVEIDALKVWDSGFLSAACQAVASNTPTLYITDESAPQGTAVPVLEIKSENGALTYVHVYDALLSGKLSVLQCNDIPLEQRLQINQEVEQSGLRQQIFGTTE